MLRIIAACRSRYRRDLKVLLVGEGPDEASIRATVAELGIADLVTISGWVVRERLPELYASARCFVIASHHEGFATTLLESHACGIPACTTEAGYCGTFVREHGARTGFVFAERDLERPDFYRDLFDLVDNHASYRESCIAKAALFGEEAVLGKIYQEICL